MEDINDNNYNEFVLYKVKRQKKPFVLFFYSEKCKYCSNMENILQSLLKEYKNKIFFFKINTENRILVEKYKIRGTPTLLIFDKYLFLKKRYIGNQADYKNVKEEILKIIEKNTILVEFLRKYKE